MPFICIFSEWEHPPAQKIKNAFTNNLKPAPCKRKPIQKTGRNFKNIGVFKDFQNRKIILFVLLLLFLATRPVATAPSIDCLAVHSPAMQPWANDYSY